MTREEKRERFESILKHALDQLHASLSGYRDDPPPNGIASARHANTTGEIDVILVFAWGTGAAELHSAMRAASLDENGKLITLSPPPIN